MFADSSDADSFGIIADNRFVFANCYNTSSFTCFMLSLQCIEALLDKFKEKKPAIVAALRDAVDATFLTVSTAGALSRLLRSRWYFYQR